MVRESLSSVQKVTVRENHSTYKKFQGKNPEEKAAFVSIQTHNGEKTGTED